MTQERNCDKVDKKISATIDRIIKKFKENPSAWNDERQVHYDFFKLLFDQFSPEVVKENCSKGEFCLGVSGRKTLICQRE